MAKLENESLVLNPNHFVSINCGSATTSSLKVAKAFGKQHKDVLRKLESVGCSPEFNERNFTLVNYVDAKGEKRPAYEMTKDGFMFLVMGFTGKKAAQIKEAYINAFNTMAEQLQQQQATQQTPHTLADHSADQSRIKQLTFEGQPVLTLAMVNKLHQLPSNTAQRIYQKEKAGFPLGDVIKVDDRESLQLLREAGVRVGSSILLLNASGYRRLAILLYGEGFDVESGPTLKDYFGLVGDYSLDELQTLREAYELIMQWSHSEASDLSTNHRSWLKRRWHQQANHFANTKRLLKDPLSDEYRRDVADHLITEAVYWDHIANSDERRERLTQWRLDVREFNLRYGIVPGSGFIPRREFGSS